MYKDETLPQGTNVEDSIKAALKQRDCDECLQDLKVKGTMWELSPGQVGGIFAATYIM